MSRSTIERFYAAFARLDADTLQACCASNAAFDFRAWSRQAPGLPGWLPGWTPWLRHKGRAQAADGLRRFPKRG